MTSRLFIYICRIQDAARGIFANEFARFLSPFAIFSEYGMRPGTLRKRRLSAIAPAFSWPYVYGEAFGSWRRITDHMDAVNEMGMTELVGIHDVVKATMKYALRWWFVPVRFQTERTFDFITISSIMLISMPDPVCGKSVNDMVFLRRMLYDSEKKDEIALW